MSDATKNLKCKTNLYRLLEAKGFVSCMREKFRSRTSADTRGLSFYKLFGKTSTYYVKHAIFCYICLVLNTAATRLEKITIASLDTSCKIQL